MSNSKFGRGFTGKGYYIALILCAAAIGITGYVFYQNQETPEEVIVQETGDYVPAGTVTPQTEDLPVIATQPQHRPAATVPVPTQPPVKQTMQVVSPLSGDTLAEYAMEALSYNQTTRDWRVHNGVDIAAEEGTPVAAAAEGTVVTAGEDGAMGYSVVIRHNGGYTTTYACLQESLSVAPGDSVSAGQVIGTVGSSALVETALGSHLHFAVTCQGKAMDPAEFLALGS